MKKSFMKFYVLHSNRINTFVLIFFFNLFSIANTFATIYYVDNINGNNSNNGISSGTAWFDFTNINSRTFVAGDQILLKSGCVWNSELHLKGSGTSSNFITLDAYGAGNKPKIQRNNLATDRTVYLDDISYFKFRNLEVCNAGDGIRLNYTVKGQTSVYFENLYVHNIDIIVNASPNTPDGVYYSTGILINSTLPKPTSINDYVAADIRITNCEIAFTTAPFTFLHTFNNPSGSNTESPWSYKNVLVDNNSLHDFKGPISSRDMNNSIISNNNCKNGGTSSLPQGTTGFFNFNLDNVIFEGNIMDNIPNTNSYDQTWVDNEAYCNYVQLYGNLIKNTAGSGVEFLALGGGSPPRGTDDYNTNNIIDGNTFSNNGSGALKLIGTAPAIPSGTASNNVYQTNNTFFNGTSSGFTLSNNNSNSQSSTNLALYKSYIASSNWDNNQRASKAFDGSVATNWQSANTGYANQWLRINFGANTTFDKVVLSEYGNRTSGFRIEYSNDGITWQTAYTGSTIGNSNTITFTAVTGKMARIYFTNGANTPIIFEFEIYPVAQAGGSNLASNKTYYSSSDWDATQTADKGFDGNYSTDWQSANGSAFANQWLQVNFGAPTAFDSIKLSEYGGRTTGYSIEYSSNGTSWQTAYTGTTIDTSKTITFAAVTGNYARIFFTSGANTPIIFEFEVYKKQVTTNPNLSLNKTYGSSSNWDATQTADKACDANPGTNWQAVNGSAFSGQWLQVNFGATTTFNRVILSEYGNRTTGYHIEYSNDGTSWQIAYTGTTIGASTTVNFTAVTGNYVRVFFTSGSNTPIIYEFEIYNSAANRVAQIKQPVTIIDEKPLSTIYPNPSHGFVNVFYKLPKKSRASVTIYTLEGKVIQQLNFTSMDAECGKIDLNIQSVNSGTYIIKISSKDHLVAHKLIIVK